MPVVAILTEKQATASGSKNFRELIRPQVDFTRVSSIRLWIMCSSYPLLG